MSNYRMYGPTGPTRVVTYCTPQGSARLSMIEGKRLLVEFSGFQPFTISPDGVEALKEALERLTEGEE